MNSILLKLNPAVPRGLLAPLAGVTWCLVGIMLLTRSTIWLLADGSRYALAAIVIGLAMGAFLLPRAFMRLVDKNMLRLGDRPERACVFSIFAWRSWAMVVVMSFGGILLRHSPTPRLFLAAPYLGMGICLFGGAIHYFRRISAIQRQVG